MRNFPERRINHKFSFFFIEDVGIDFGQVVVMMCESRDHTSNYRPSSSSSALLLFDFFVIYFVYLALFGLLCVRYAAFRHQFFLIWEIPSKILENCSEMLSDSSRFFDALRDSKGNQ